MKKILQDFDVFVVGGVLLVPVLVGVQVMKAVST